MKFLFQMCLMSLLISFTSTPNELMDESPICNDLETFKITFIGIKEVYNDHVGNEWISYCEIDAENIFKDDFKIIKISKGGELKLISILGEVNEKHNDYAKVESILNYSDFIHFQGSGFYVLVTITEGNGRYAGNEAQFKFLYSIE